MELDLSSIDDNQQYRQQQIFDEHNQQSQQFIINEVGNNQYQNGLVLNDNQDDSHEEFRRNLQSILNTQFGQCSDSARQNNQNKQEIPQDDDFGQPLKGSFLQEMQRLGKTISFESTVFDAYNPDLSKLTNQPLLQKLLTNEKPNIQISKQSSIKDKLLWSVKSKIHETYIIDFSKCKKQRSIKTNNFLTSMDMSKHTTQSIKKVKKSPNKMHNFSKKQLNSKKKSINTKKRSTSKKNVRKSENSWSSLSKPAFNEPWKNGFNSLTSHLTNQYVTKCKNKVLSKQIQKNKLKVSSKFRL